MLCVFAFGHLCLVGPHCSSEMDCESPVTSTAMSQKETYGAVPRTREMEKKATTARWLMLTVVLLILGAACAVVVALLARASHVDGNSGQVEGAHRVV